MNDETSREPIDLRDAMRDEYGAGGEPGGEHPPLTAWIEYRRGSLSGEREVALRDHLVRCRECVNLLADLAAFEDAEEADDRAGRASDAEVDAVLETVRSRPEETAPRTTPWLLPLAAGLLLGAALASLLWVVTLQDRGGEAQRRLAALSGPHPGADIVDLYAGAETRNGAAPAETVLPIGPDTAYVTCVLHLPPDADADRYRAELRDGRERVVWEGEGLERSPRFNTARLGIPRSFLETGRYTLALHGGGDPAGEPIAEYRFDVRHSGPDAPR
ncbi:MAG: hypothetical protein PVG07_01805 [Acidobacteriota bacterium]|jgi:hypothetical protein